MISSFIPFVEKEGLLETANEIGQLQPVAKNTKEDTAPSRICALTIAYDFSIIVGNRFLLSPGRGMGVGEDFRGDHLIFRRTKGTISRN